MDLYISHALYTTSKSPLQRSTSRSFQNAHSERPLSDTLDPFRDKLRDLNEADDPRQEDIASLLSALVASPAAFSLSSPDESGSVAVKLLSILQYVRGGEIKTQQFHPLVRHVVDDSSDIDVWEAVFTVIESLSALTPPPSSIAPTFKGTPIKTSSSRLADSETRDIVEGELFYEIKDCTFRDVKGFCDKFFYSKRWRKEQKAMLKEMMTAHDGKKWTDFPTPSDEKPVWDWFCSLEERFLADSTYKLHTTKTAHQFKERKGQMDVFFQAPAKKKDGTFWYKHVLVVGEQKKSYDTGRFKADRLQIFHAMTCLYFSTQPWSSLR